eukprot:TRINITY_DN68126_c0_g1_i1.p1 TRINITY_DN68126_c0_g1~~TRINITY_DN68126_c0_g1_i1.p1  ORF type:complete len:440 (-),score=74.29 TRINITY_DN68126_c0_g1_i1:141-1460(-)
MSGPSVPPSSVLTGDEERWRDAFDRLRERFPTVAPERVAQALRNHDGHAGGAASELRDMTSFVVKPPDPGDSEHVATLLSSPVMFKHACKEQFKKFDTNGDGVLQWTEILQLVNELYYSFGLQEPSENCLKAFFHATDENGDEVLNEREFRKFFEMFLRYAFFDVVKMKQIIEAGKMKMATVGDEKSSNQQIGPSTTQAAVRSGRHEREPREQQREARESGESREHRDRGSGESRHIRQNKREDNDQNARHKDKAIAEGAGEGYGSGTTLICTNANGISYRSSADFSERMASMVEHGQTVQVLEQWVRTTNGWLPVYDLSGNLLLERQRRSRVTERGDTRHRGSERNESSPTSQRVRIADSRRAESETADQPAQTKQKAASKSTGVVLSAELGALPEEWKSGFERLSDRFPNAGASLIVQALIDNDGHAGKAASALRDS